MPPVGMAGAFLEPPRREPRWDAVARDDATDLRGIWLATTPVDQVQRRLTQAVMAALGLAFVVAAAFHNIPAPRSDGFIPAVQAVMSVCDLLTATMLFTQFAILRARALLVLANGYLFAALMTAIHTLVFPGAFAPDGLLGAGLQTAGWLKFIWHLALPAAVIGYALLKTRKDADIDPASAKTAILGSIVGQTALVVTLTGAIIAADAHLPRLLLDKTTFAPLVVHTGWFTALVGAVALVLLRARQGSVLDRWVMVAVLASVLEMAMVTVIEARFTVGWYSVRAFGVAASAIVLIALITETTRLYARLAAATRVLERERDTRLMNAHAITAAITHEIRQPLTGLAASGGAGIRFLDQNPPDLVKARDALHRVVGASHRVSDILEGISALFGKGDQRRRPVDLNQVVLDVLQMMQDEAKARLIDIRIELTTGLPLVSGDGSQLREVVTNLVQNAFDAMGGTVNRGRALRVRTQLRGLEIVVAVEDSGPGIQPDRLGEIFGAFVTTKAQGTGLGLAICRMIVEHHGGQLTASSDGVSGALFQVVLPAEIATAAEAREGRRSAETTSPQAA